MKRTLTLALLLLFLAAPAFGTVEYVDFVSGDDDTGDGSYSSPWATIGKCTTSKTGGDECRVAKQTPVALTGTLTYTNASATITTSADLTGDLAQYDHIGKAVDGSSDGWWEIASVTSDTITLAFPYWGTAETVTAYKAPFFTLTGDVDINSDGTSSASMLKVSGGWDLSTQTQDGWTFLTNGGGFDPVSGNGRDWVEFSKFVIFGGVSSSDDDIYWIHPVGCLLKDLVLSRVAMSLSPGASYSDFVTLENILWTGSIYELIVANSMQYAYFKNLTSLSHGSSNSYSPFDIDNNSNVFFENITVKNSYATSVIVADSRDVWIKGLTVDTVRYSSAHGLLITSSGFVRVSDVDISNVTQHGIYALYDIAGVKIKNYTYSNLGLRSINWYDTRQPGNPTVIVESFGGVAGDDREYYCSNNNAYDSSYTQRDTTEARSGTCVKFVPSYNFDMNKEMLKVQVADGDSDLNLSVYAKDDADFDGQFVMYASSGGKFLTLPTAKTLTTSYVQQTITVPSADIATGDWITLWVVVNATDGAVYVDDASSSQ